MKKLRACFIAAMLLAFSASSVWAIDVDIKGNWGFSYGILQNGYKYSNRSSEDAAKNGKETQDRFWATSRVRTQIDFKASENLWAKLYLEIGKMDWGTPADGAKGAPLDADMVNIKTKNAYLHYVVPQTDLNIRMGIQNIALPQAVGENPVFNDDVAGVSASYQVNDLLGVTTFWARPFDRGATDANRNLTDEQDIFGLTVPITPKGFKITPWAVYSAIGNDSGYFNYMYDETNASKQRGKYGFDKWGKANSDWYLDSKGTNPYGHGGSSNAWWAGTSFEMNLFSPWKISADVMYGALHGDKDAPDTRGWFIDAAVDYKASWGTPGVFAWYSSGDDDWSDGDRSGRMPILGLDTGFAISSFGFADGWGLRGDQAAFTSGVGTWALGARITKISFLQDLSHTLRFIYARGTNDVDSAKVKQSDSRFYGVDFHGFYLTDKDQYFEVNVDSFYQIYKNLEMGVELGWIKVDLDQNTWKHSQNNLSETSDAWKAMLSFKYRF